MHAPDVSGRSRRRAWRAPLPLSPRRVRPPHRASARGAAAAPARPSRARGSGGLDRGDRHRAPRRMSARSKFARDQKVTIAGGILAIVALIVILQLWIFTASMNALLGGDTA